MPRWLDATATIVDGRVLLTPAESESLFCLNLADGQPAWEPVPRRAHDDLYVACVHRGTIVLAGRHEVHGVRLADGKPAWDGRTRAAAGRRRASPAAASTRPPLLPAHQQRRGPGRSIWTAAEQVHGGQVAQGQRARQPGLLSRAESSRRGWTAWRPSTRSDAAREEIRQRLAANPDDAEALSLRGEMLLDEGQAGRGGGRFPPRLPAGSRTANRRLRTRDCCATRCWTASATDFADHRADAPEIERLLDEPAQWALYLRLMAGRLAAGRRLARRPGAVLEAGGPGGLEAAAGGRGPLVPGAPRPLGAGPLESALRQSAGARRRPSSTRRLRERLRRATRGQGARRLRQFVNDFGGQPAAAEARRELLARLARGRPAAGGRDAVGLAGCGGRHRGPRPPPGPPWPSCTPGPTGPRPTAACYRHSPARWPTWCAPAAGRASNAWPPCRPTVPVRRELGPTQPAWPRGEVEVRHGGAGDQPVDFLLALRGSLPGFAGAVLRRRHAALRASAAAARAEPALRAATAVLGRIRRLGPPAMGGPANGSRPADQLRLQPQHDPGQDPGPPAAALDGHADHGHGSAGRLGQPVEGVWSQDLTDATADTALGNRIIFQGGAAGASTSTSSPRRSADSPSNRPATAG